MSARPIIITDETRLIARLRGRRQALGISQQALDDSIGCAEGYVAKVEAPGRRYGRRVAWGLSGVLFWWLETLGLCLVLMDRREALSLTGPETADDGAPESAALIYAGRQRDSLIVNLN